MEEKVRRPLAALIVGYLAVALYLAAFHFWAEGKPRPQTLYYGFYAEPRPNMPLSIFIQDRLEYCWYAGGYIEWKTGGPGPRLATHPPGTYWLMNGLRHLSRSIYITHLVFFLLSLAAVPLLYLIGRNLYGHNAGIIAAG